MLYNAWVVYWTNEKFYIAIGVLLTFAYPRPPLLFCLNLCSFLGINFWLPKTEMTKKYEHIWEVEGAVDPSTGAKRVLYEVINNGMEETGAFINCEDGLTIPW